MRAWSTRGGNATLWSSSVIETPRHRVFFRDDPGLMGEHAAIRERFDAPQRGARLVMPRLHGEARVRLMSIREPLGMNSPGVLNATLCASNVTLT